MSIKDGFDSNKRWGNSAMKGHGVNSPAMMQARKGFSKKNKSKQRALDSFNSRKEAAERADQ